MWVPEPPGPVTPVGSGKKGSRWQVVSVTIQTQRHHLLHAPGLSTKWAVTSHSSHPPKCPRTLSSFLHHVATTGVLISAGYPHDGDHKVTIINTRHRSA